MLKETTKVFNTSALEMKTTQYNELYTEMF